MFSNVQHQKGFVKMVVKPPLMLKKQGLKINKALVKFP